MVGWFDWGWTSSASLATNSLNKDKSKQQMDHVINMSTSDQSKQVSVNLGTLSVHLGHAADPMTGAIIPPISLSTTFEQRSPGVPVSVQSSPIMLDLQTYGF